MEDGNVIFLIFQNSSQKLRTTVLCSPFIPVNGMFLTIYQFLSSRAAENHTSFDYYQMVGTLYSSWVITICSGIDFRSIRVPGFYYFIIQVSLSYEIQFL